MDEYNVFVRISTNGGKDTKEKMINKAYNNNQKNEGKYMIGGGILNKNGCTLVYRAKNLQEAKNVTEYKNLVNNINLNYNIMFIPKQLQKV